MTPITREERADSPAARELIAELDAVLDPQHPAESRHGYSVDRLLDADVAFFVVYLDGNAAGCGGVELVGREYAELKRMYVRPGFRGRGLGRHPVEHLTRHAREHGIATVRLETGSTRSRRSRCTPELVSSGSARSGLTARTRTACSWSGGSGRGPDEPPGRRPLDAPVREHGATADDRPHHPAS